LIFEKHRKNSETTEYYSLKYSALRKHKNDVLQTVFFLIYEVKKKKLVENIKFASFVFVL
jgi:hypothetical protein